MGTSAENDHTKEREQPRAEIRNAEPGAHALVAAPKHSLVPQEAGSAALSAQVEANVKARLFLARQFPRSIGEVRVKLLEAFKRPILAEGAIYSKPIGGKSVQGLSIRFAEEAARVMGNLNVDTMLVSDDEDKRSYIVTGTDLESLFTIQVTVVVTKQIERSTVKGDSIILGKRTNSSGGTTYILRATSEDDYRSKEQALLQKARRDVILFLIPGDIKEECEAQIRKTTRDRDKEDPQGAINRITDAFYALGVSIAELEKFLGHPLKITNDAERDRLRTAYTALKDGEATWAQIVEAKLDTNTGADQATTAKSTTDRLKQVVKSEEKAATQRTAEESAVAETEKGPAIPGHIRSLYENESVPGALDEEGRAELAQWRKDHPGVLPDPEATKGKTK